MRCRVIDGRTEEGIAYCAGTRAVCGWKGWNIGGEGMNQGRHGIIINYKVG